MSNLRIQLQKNKTVRGRRWTIRRDAKGKLTEVKMIYCPDEYIKSTNSKTMYGDKALLKILTKEFNKKE